MGKAPKEVIVRGTTFAQWPELTADWHDVGRVTIDMLPDHVLLEIFGFYVDEKKRGMHAGSCVSKMAKRRFWVARSPKHATFVQCRNTS